MSISPAAFDVFGSTMECSDVHIRMIHLRQSNKRDEDLGSI
jgi:hypothetical protein